MFYACIGSCWEETSFNERHCIYNISLAGLNYPSGVASRAIVQLARQCKYIDLCLLKKKPSLWNIIKLLCPHQRCYGSSQMDTVIMRQTPVTTSTVYWCIASKLKAPRNFYWMSNMFLWVEIFLFFVCYHVVPKRHSQLDYEFNGL